MAKNKTNNEEWITNGNPGEFPKPNDAWDNNDNGWYDNGHPASDPHFIDWM